MAWRHAVEWRAALMVDADVILAEAIEHKDDQVHDVTSWVNRYKLDVEVILHGNGVERNVA